MLLFWIYEMQLLRRECTLGKECFVSSSAKGSSQKEIQLDFGYFQNQTLNIEQNLYSAGIGLGIQTKAGILKLNIANGISEQQNFNFSNTKIHLSLTSKF